MYPYFQPLKQPNVNQNRVHMVRVHNFTCILLLGNADSTTFPPFYRKVPWVHLCRSPLRSSMSLSHPHPSHSPLDSIFEVEDDTVISLYSRPLYIPNPSISWICDPDFIPRLLEVKKIFAFLQQFSRFRQFYRV